MNGEPFEYFGEFMAYHVVHGGRLDWELCKLWDQQYDDAHGEDRARRFGKRLQTRAGVYTGASTAAGAKFIYKKMRGGLLAYPIDRDIAALSVPSGAVASAMVVRWLEDVPSGYSRHNADIAYGRHTRDVEPGTGFKCYNIEL